MTDFQKVLARVQTDYDFYLSLKNDPAAALAPFDLTTAERDALVTRRSELGRLILQGEVRRGIGGGFHFAEEGPPDEGPPDEGPPQDGPPQEGPPQEGPPQEGPPQEGPPQEGPPQEGPPQEGPPQEGPPQEGPPQEGPPQEGPPQEGPPQEGPPPHIGVVEGPPQEGPPLEGPPIEGPAPGVGIIPIGGGGIGVTPSVGDPPSPGIRGVFHFLTDFDAAVLPEASGPTDLLSNQQVVRAVQNLRNSSTANERRAAVRALMEEIG